MHLNEHDRAISQSCVMEERSYAEIAEQTGRSEAALRSQLYRAKKHLRNDPTLKMAYEIQEG